MTKTWVVNSSPTILLGKIQQLNLLTVLCTQLVILQAVADEINDGPIYDPARLWLASSGRCFIRPDVLDDGAARRCAKTLGIPMTGTLGVLMRAKKKSQIAALTPLVEQLVQNGFRIDPQTLEYVLDWSNEGG